MNRRFSFAGRIDQGLITPNFTFIHHMIALALLLPDRASQPGSRVSAPPPAALLEDIRKRPMLTMLKKTMEAQPLAANPLPPLIHGPVSPFTRNAAMAIHVRVARWGAVNGMPDSMTDSITAPTTGQGNKRTCNPKNKDWACRGMRLRYPK